MPGNISLVVLRSHWTKLFLDFKPGRRKKLRDGLKDQGGILLFHHFDGFTNKRKL
jgi:hypothetical protein